MSFLVAAQSQGPLGPYRSWKQGRAMLRSRFPDNILITQSMTALPVCNHIMTQNITVIKVLQGTYLEDLVYIDYHITDIRLKILR
jgi:hypothetical protein